MQGTSKVILGATLIMVVSLAIVLGLILVLLVELYCSLLLRRRRLRVAPPNPTASPSADAITTTTNISELLPSDSTTNPSATFLSSLYAHGVLNAPRNFLFPTVPCVKNIVVDQGKKQNSQLHQLINIHTQESSLISTPSRPSSPLIIASPAQSLSKVYSESRCSNIDGASNGSDHFMYISNPIYDNDAIRPSRGDTPFETPNSSPSRLERRGSSDDDEIEAASSSTPPLTPMKKLPAEACSITLGGTGCLATSGSDSITNNGLSSSSSGSPCTSPSW